MKYDFGIELNNRNSMTILLEKIKPNSSILEFGCASGRMTRHLKETLDCDVYIVEIDQDGYDKAMCYAKNGLLGDIEDFAWENAFQGVRFDYVVFADVLEHLVNPLDVLRRVVKYLSEDGIILVSIPNIAHDSVIVDLINNRFKYRELGILDNTHLRFFTRESLRELFMEANLSIVSEEAIYKDITMTEFGNSYRDIPFNLRLAMQNRSFKQIYQFVYQVKVKNEDDNQNTVTNLIERFNDETFRCYIDTGNGYNETQVISRGIKCGKNEILLDLTAYGELQTLRFDFIDEQCCVMVNSLIIDGNSIECDKLSGNYSFALDNIYVYNDDDPQIYLTSIGKSIKSLCIEFTVEKLYKQELLSLFISGNHQKG